MAARLNARYSFHSTCNTCFLASPHPHHLLTIPIQDMHASTKISTNNLFSFLQTLMRSLEINLYKISCSLYIVQDRTCRIYITPTVLHEMWENVIPFIDLQRACIEDTISRVVVHVSMLSHLTLPWQWCFTSKSRAGDISLGTLWRTKIWVWYCPEIASVFALLCFKFHMTLNKRISCNIQLISKGKSSITLFFVSAVLLLLSTLSILTWLSMTRDSWYWIFQLDWVFFHVSSMISAWKWVVVTTAVFFGWDYYLLSWKCISYHGLI